MLSTSFFECFMKKHHNIFSGKLLWLGYGFADILQDCCEEHRLLVLARKCSWSKFLRQSLKRCAGEHIHRRCEAQYPAFELRLEEFQRFTIFLRIRNIPFSIEHPVRDPWDIRTTDAKTLLQERTNAVQRRRRRNGRCIRVIDIHRCMNQQAVLSRQIIADIRRDNGIRAVHKERFGFFLGDRKIISIAMIGEVEEIRDVILTEVLLALPCFVDVAQADIRRNARHLRGGFVLLAPGENRH